MCIFAQNVLVGFFFFNWLKMDIAREYKTNKILNYVIMRPQKFKYTYTPHRDMWECDSGTLTFFKNTHVLRFNNIINLNEIWNTICEA
jgi:hypothetical protein